MIYAVRACGVTEAQLAFNYHDDPILGTTLAYWLRKRDTSSMPRKCDIDPTEIHRKILPNLQIIDVIDDGARFRYRLVGTALVEANGKDYTGQYPEELLSEDRAAFVLNIYRTVYKLKGPLFTTNRYHTTKNIDLFTSRIYMPLSDDGVNVHYIFGVLRFESGIGLDRGTWGNGRLDPAGQYMEPIEVDPPIAA
jgi:hypothetical protein